MKKRVLIACTMQMDVINYVLKKYQISMPVIWLERALHHNLPLLHKELQNQVDLQQHMDEIVLSYGLCGHAISGLYSKKARLVFPAFDDCICQLLYTGSEKSRRYGLKEKGCYYLTREWTIDKEAIVPQCEMILKQYGEECGKEIIQQIYSGYHTISLIETGAYDVGKLRSFVEKASELTGMCVKLQEGSCRVMEHLLLGNYDNTICVVNPGERIGHAIEIG